MLVAREFRHGHPAAVSNGMRVSAVPQHFIAF
jgi:hypothetical protein